MQIRIADEKDIKSVFSLRFEVFVDEQNVPPEIEIDNEDDNAIHIIAEENGNAIGCGRLVLGEFDAHIGRLAVKKTHRGSGIGAKICEFIIDYCYDNGYKNIWLNSQLQAKTFYEKLGFIPQGETFIEAGIEHIKMVIK